MRLQAYILYMKFFRYQGNDICHELGDILNHLNTILSYIGKKKMRIDFVFSFRELRHTRAHLPDLMVIFRYQTR